MQRRPLLLLLLLVLDVTRALLASPHGTAARLSRPARSSCLQLNWLKAKKEREEREREAFRERMKIEEAAKVEREAKAKLEREAAEEKRRDANKKMQDWQDNVDFYRPGGVLRQPTKQLTKGDLENAQVTRSPVIDAEKRLQDVTARAGTLGSQEEAIALLSEALAAADQARVPATSPQRKAAAALLSAYEQAASDASAPEAEGPPKDKMQATMDAIFSDEYAMPGLDDDIL